MNILNVAVLIPDTFISRWRQPDICLFSVFNHFIYFSEKWEITVACLECSTIIINRKRLNFLWTRRTKKLHSRVSDRLRRQNRHRNTIKRGTRKESDVSLESSSFDARYLRDRSKFYEAFNGQILDVSEGREGNGERGGGNVLPIHCSFSTLFFGFSFFFVSFSSYNYWTLL